MKVLYLVNIPSPYRVKFFNELGKKCDLSVIYELNSAEDRDKSWMNEKAVNFTEYYLKGRKIGADNALSFEVITYLNKLSFDIIVIGGYSSPSAMLAILYLKLKKIPFILNADGGFIQLEEKKIKYLIKKMFISSASAWLSTGKQTTEYLCHYGANKQNIYLYPFSSIDEKRIPQKLLSNEQKEIIRMELEIPTSYKYILLSIGQFIPRKGFDVLLKSCEKLSNEIGVYIIGGSPTEDYLRLVKELNLQNINFLEFKSQEELSKYYQVADVFILPTREDIWGLVINEAMAYGLPIITTTKCIAGNELIINNENGFLIESEDYKSLYNNVINLISNIELKKNMGNNNLNKIKSLYTIQKMAIIHFEIFSDFLLRGNN